MTNLCDWGERYLSKVFDDDWMRENGFLERPRTATAGEMAASKEGAPEHLLSVAPTTSVQMALSAITTHGVSQVPVLMEHECVGTVTESEAMAAVLEDPSVLDRPVESIMAPPLPVVDAHASGEEVHRLLTRSTPAVLVRGSDRFSIVTRFDVVRALTQNRA